MLQGAGAGAAAFAVTGLASAAPTDTVEVNVGFSAESGKQAALSNADAVVREFDHIDVVTLQLPKRAADALAARAAVRYVERNGTMRKLAEVKWGVDRVDRVDAEVATNNGDTGSGADVAVIDTGIDSDHPDLQSHVGKGHAVYECGSGCQCFFIYSGGGNSNTCHEPWDDDNDHGTHCAGIPGAIDRAATSMSSARTRHPDELLQPGSRDRTRRARRRHPVRLDVHGHVADSDHPRFRRVVDVFDDHTRYAIDEGCSTEWIQLPPESSSSTLERPEGSLGSTLALHCRFLKRVL